jgi:hypothetical protein
MIKKYIFYDFFVCPPLNFGLLLFKGFSSHFFCYNKQLFCLSSCVCVPSKLKISLPFYRGFSFLRGFSRNGKNIFPFSLCACTFSFKKKMILSCSVKCTYITVKILCYSGRYRCKNEHETENPYINK